MLDEVMPHLVHVTGWRTCVNNLPVQIIARRSARHCSGFGAQGPLGALAVATSLRAPRTWYQKLAVCASNRTSLTFVSWKSAWTGVQQLNNLMW